MFPGGAGGGGGFDPAMLQQMMSSPQFAAVQQMLNSPEIRELTTQLTADPSLMDAMKEMQSAAMTGNFASAMSALQGNPRIMNVAKSIGEKMFSQSPLAAALQDPDKKTALEQQMKELKDDPELKGVMEELQKNGPEAMSKFWADPEVLKKFSKYGERLVKSGLFPGADEHGADALAKDLSSASLTQGEAAADEEEFVCLQDAVTEGDLDLLKQILDADIPPDDADDEDRTALHFACGYGEMACAKELLGRGANVNIADSNKNTPLHYSAGYGQLETTKLLLEQPGLDLTLKNNEGHTALDVAIINDQKEIEAAIQAKVAK